ncbi:MAG: glycosyltransferase family 2 protein [Nitrosopumilus sp.]
MKHLLTFIIPTYNREKTIREAIDSIYKQQLNIPFEVRVFDDCSTDFTGDILSSYEKECDSFFVHRCIENKGPAAGRNTCVAHSRGDLIFNLDSDNFLEPNTVNDLIELLDKTKFEAASFSAAKIFKGMLGSYVSKGSIVYNCGDVCSLRSFMRTSRIPPSQGNYLYTRESFDLAGGYPEGDEARVLETYRFGFRQLLAGARIAILPNSFYWHRWSRDSKWRKNHSLGINDRAMVNEFRKFPNLFTDETNKLLAGNELVKEKTFFKKINRGHIKLK